MKDRATVLVTIVMVVLFCGVWAGAEEPVQDPAAGQKKEALAPQGGRAILSTENLVIGLETRRFVDRVIPPTNSVAPIPHFRPV
jgi:hypothetical protein